MNTRKDVGGCANGVSVFGVETAVVRYYVAFDILVVDDWEAGDGEVPGAWEVAERVEEEAIDAEGEEREGQLVGRVSYVIQILRGGKGNALRSKR
jgi:hypothetical protein